MTAIRCEPNVLDLDRDLELARSSHAGAHSCHVGAREVLNATNSLGIKAGPGGFVGT